MKIEPTYIAGASLIEIEAQRNTVAVKTEPEVASAPTENTMSYDDLLPYLLLPMAGAY